VVLPISQSIPSSFQRMEETPVAFNGHNYKKITYHDNTSLLLKIGKIIVACLIILTLAGLCFSKAVDYCSYAFYMQFQTRFAYYEIANQRDDIQDKTPSGNISALIQPNKIKLTSEELLAIIKKKSEGTDFALRPRLDKLAFHVGRIICQFLTSSELHYLSQANSHQNIVTRIELPKRKISSEGFKGAIEHMPTSLRKKFQYGVSFLPYSEEEQTLRFTKLKQCLHQIHREHINKIWGYRTYNDSPIMSVNLLWYALLRIENNPERLLDAINILIDRGINLTIPLDVSRRKPIESHQVDILTKAKELGDQNLIKLIETALAKIPPETKAVASRFQPAL
jgi:hypothetical protein